MGNRSNILLVGNTTTAQNLGGGTCVFKCKDGGNNLQFKTIAVLGSLSITSDGTTITISGATGGGTGGTSYNFISSGATVVSKLGNNVTIYSPFFTGGTGTITGATNGLSVSGRNIVLGGTLTGTTTINGAQTLNINQAVLNLSGNTCVNITGAVKLLSTPANGASSTTGLVWDTGTTQIKGVPVIDEWVSSISNLCYTGQKFAYDTQSIFQNDVGNCIVLPNYVFIKNINIGITGNTYLFQIPTGKAAFINRAKLIFLCCADVDSFCVSIGNNACPTNPALSYNNLVTCVQISNVHECQTYDLSLLACAVAASVGTAVCFRVGNPTSSYPLCANLLLEGFLF
jgi:hypothetical protein